MFSEFNLNSKGLSVGRRGIKLRKEGMFPHKINSGRAHRGHSVTKKNWKLPSGTRGKRSYLPRPPSASTEVKEDNVEPKDLRTVL